MRAKSIKRDCRVLERKEGNRGWVVAAIGRRGSCPLSAS